MVASAAGAVIPQGAVVHSDTLVSVRFTAEIGTTGTAGTGIIGTAIGITPITTMISSFLAASRSGAGAILTGVIPIRIIRTLTAITRTGVATMAAVTTEAAAIT